MKKRERKPWEHDIFGDWDEIIERIFESIKMDTTNMDEIKSRPVIYGFSLTQRPGEEPEIQEFGNIHPSSHGFEIGERKPLIDVFESEDEVHVVAEMPGVDKEDIKLDATETSLYIRAKTESVEYSEHVDLPVSVDTDSAKASYKNGVLDITLKRAKLEAGKTPIKVE
ncbi:MAG: Hsp20/alpha crystallin family protein [Methanocellales archaeon]|nr:Hsp20/alpha crystallin family protein [Methanocellales archaeon]MDD4897975.1 Hsp20/alpha crystallin family protein [Methanocellales archaeon]MDD5446779.1 Hsp20/alpha crystallin family protein [Methanocellales archaeon]